MLSRHHNLVSNICNSFSVSPFFALIFSVCVQNHSVTTDYPGNSMSRWAHRQNEKLLLDTNLQMYFSPQRFSVFQQKCNAWTIGCTFRWGMSHYTGFIANSLYTGPYREEWVSDFRHNPCFSSSFIQCVMWQCVLFLCMEIITVWQCRMGEAIVMFHSSIHFLIGDYFSLNCILGLYLVWVFQNFANSLM